MKNAPRFYAEIIQFLVSVIPINDPNLVTCIKNCLDKIVMLIPTSSIRQLTQYSQLLLDTLSSNLRVFSNNKIEVFI